MHGHNLCSSSNRGVWHFLHLCVLQHSIMQIMPDHLYYFSANASVLPIAMKVKAQMLLHPKSLLP